jgi:hypothetical protein
MNKLIDGIKCDGKVRWEFMRVDRDLLGMGEGSQGGEVMSEGRIKEGVWVIRRRRKQGEIWDRLKYFGTFWWVY